MNTPAVARFAATHHLVFRDPDLLQRSFVHRSYVNELSPAVGPSTNPATGSDDNTERALTDNERLEFLGDAVLSFVVGEELFLRFPDFTEGPLTNLRAALVRRESLAGLAKQLEMGSYLLLGRGEEETGGRTRLATLCACFEALAGAIYLDQGMDAVRAFVLPMFRTELARVQQYALDKDAKSRLQEHVQSTRGVTPKYKMVENGGPDHAKTFVMQVKIGDEVVGAAQGRSKQDATLAAAAVALHHLGQIAPEYIPDPELENRYGLM